MHPFHCKIVSLTNRQCPNNLYDSICFIRLIHLRVETPVAPLELIFLYGCVSIHLSSLRDSRTQIICTMYALAALAGRPVYRIRIGKISQAPAGRQVYRNQREPNTSGTLPFKQGLGIILSEIGNQEKAYESINHLGYLCTDIRWLHQCRIPEDASRT